MADALLKWRKAELERQKVEALKYMQYKHVGAEKRTVSEIEALVHSDEDRYQAKLAEALAESEYTRLLEKLYATKRLLGSRTAF